VVELKLQMVVLPVLMLPVTELLLMTVRGLDVVEIAHMLVALVVIILSQNLSSCKVA
jgi:hypothetical protein